jgi:Methylamine utilisation protein MauE
MAVSFVFDPLPVWIAVALIATLLAHAALAKFADLALFEQHLAAYRVPQALRPFALRALPALELGIAALLLSPWRAVGAALAGALLCAYGAAMAWHRLQGHALDCGCGGEPLPVSWPLVVRNALLALLALAAAGAMTARAMGLADFAVVAASVVLATLLYAAFHQVLRHRVGLRPHHSH